MPSLNASKAVSHCSLARRRRHRECPIFRAVRRAKEQWETAFDALSEGIAVVDDEGRVRRSNRALAGLLNMPLQNVLGTPLARRYWASRMLSRSLLAATRRGDRPAPLVARSERLAARGPRQRRPHSGRSDRAEHRRDGRGRDEQQALETQLVQSEKLAAVGQLVSGVAHELNNPLTFNRGTVEFCSSRRSSQEGSRPFAGDSGAGGACRPNRAQSPHLRAQRRRRAGAGGLERRDSPDAVADIYDLKLKDIQVERELSGALPDVFGDRHGLQQVVLNLVTNAAHAVAENRASAPRNTVSTWFDGQVHLRVADTGPVFRRNRAAERLHAVLHDQEPGKGTGLGYRSRISIVESHGGQITLEPRGPRGGAAFRVDLPPAPADAVRPALTPVHGTPAVNAASTVKRTILLVDGDPAVAANDQGALRARRP